MTQNWKWSKHVGEAPRAPKVVAIIDGDPTMHTLISGYLKKIGVERIDCFTTGDDATKSMDSISYDMMIVDWKLKQPSGLNLYKQIRAREGSKETPMILMAGLVTKEDIASARDSNNTHFLVKPFTEEILIKLVSTAYAGAVLLQSIENSDDFPSPSGVKSTVAKPGQEKGVAGQAAVQSGGDIVQKAHTGQDFEAKQERAQSGSEFNFRQTKDSPRGTDFNFVAKKGDDPAGPEDAAQGPNPSARGGNAIQENQRIKRSDAKQDDTSNKPWTMAAEDAALGDFAPIYKSAGNGPSGEEGGDTGPDGKKNEVGNDPHYEMTSRDVKSPGWSTEQISKPKSDGSTIAERLKKDRPDGDRDTDQEDSDKGLSAKKNQQDGFDGQSGPRVESPGFSHDGSGKIVSPLGGGLGGPDKSGEVGRPSGVAGASGVDAEKGTSRPSEASIRQLAKDLISNWVDKKSVESVFGKGGERFGEVVSQSRIKSALIGDSDEMLSSVLQRYLEQMGVSKIKMCKDGAEVWREVQAFSYDIVILDWRLKEVSGLCLYNRLRSRGATVKTPVMVLSGRVSRDDFRILDESPYARFIQKPFQIQIFDKFLKEMFTDIYSHEDQNNLAISALEQIHGTDQDVFKFVKEVVRSLKDGIPFAMAAGTFAMERQDFVLAEKVYKLVLGMKPKHVGAMGELGKIWHRTNRPKEAMLILKGAKHLSPQNIERICLMGELGLTLRHPDEARGYFNEALAIDPEHPVAGAGMTLSDNMAEFLDQDGKFDKDAVSMQLAGTLNVIGISYVRNGLIQRGIEQYKAAMFFIHDDGVLSKLRYNVGLAHLRGKDLQNAKDWFLRSMDIAPIGFDKPSIFFERVVKVLNATGEGQRTEAAKLFSEANEETLNQSSKAS
jgi:DNA-binding response OmpR family regulator